jgi:NosR/NirI family nitrous oxide reductase transcriptional regulator
VITRRIIVLLVPLVLVAAWIAGARRIQSGTEPHLLRSVPGAQTVASAGDGDFAAFRDGLLIGYTRISEAGGYGGPMTVAVGIDTTGLICGVSVIDHKESAAFYGKVENHNLAGSLAGRSVSDPIRAGVDVDAVTGATITSEAIVSGVRTGARAIGARRLGLAVPAETRPPIRFGWPEVVLLLLFAAGITGSYTPVPGKKPLRWTTRIAGLVLIGFVYCAPFTITNINTLLMGYLPDWRSHLYWYLMVVGVLLPLVLTRKQPYCNYVCPFGATQDSLRALSGQSRSIPPNIRKWLRRFHGALVLGVVFAAVYARNPGLTNYEVFGSLFGLTGLPWQFILLGLVLIAALFFARPWCRFLCPIQGATRYIGLVKSSFRSKTRSV